jgi:inosose dehydratase
MREYIIATAPDSWGVWFADDPHQVGWQTFLDEASEVGFRWVELGPYGYMPTEPKILISELGKRQMKLAGGTTGGALHYAKSLDNLLLDVEKVASLTAELGGEYLVFIPGMYRDQRTGALLDTSVLTEEQWLWLVHNTNELAARVTTTFSLKFAFHHHVETHVETQEQIERLMAETDPGVVGLCLDTGHLAYRHGDLRVIVRRFAERIYVIHLKQVNEKVLANAEAEGWSFAKAVASGVMVEPPLGLPDFASIEEALSGISSARFIVAEQDMYPCPPYKPYEIAARTIRFLVSRNLGKLE